VSRSLSPRVRRLLALAGASVVAGLASGHPELAVIATPFLLLIGLGLVLAREPQVTAGLQVERPRLLEAEQTRAVVTLRNEGSRAIEIQLGVARTGALAVEPAGGVTLRVPRAAEIQVDFSIRPERWGAHVLGPLFIRACDPLGIVIWDAHIDHRATLEAFPREQQLRELVAPLRTQPFLGAHVARTPGEGIEFADVRPFAAGDRVRQVNWRATARRGSLYVTDRHPEHASDLVLLLDTFAEARDSASGSLDTAVRAAASLARAHLARRDRVALVDFGGTLHWLEPAFGTTQLYRIVDALLRSQIAFSYAWRAVESIPRRVLPPGGLILAISPLLDQRSIDLITDLRTRGYDVAVVEVSPLGYTSPGPTAADTLAFRLWRLQRDALRARLRALGIGVALWEEEPTLATALEGVNQFRRSARLAAHA
jgi:uncharacterized protein (DUF58 family)